MENSQGGGLVKYGELTGWRVSIVWRTDRVAG